MELMMQASSTAKVQAAIANRSRKTSASSPPGGASQHCEQAEWNARVELAALYRSVAYYRWTDTIYNHISMRVPGEESFLLNPFGLMYDEITASSLVKIDHEGNILDDPLGMGINKSGFVIHGAIHMARPDVQCVLHTHTVAGVAVAAQKQGLLPISQHAAVVLNQIAYHDFEGIATRAEERERLVANLGNKPMMILRNHGLLVAGQSPAETFGLTMMLQRACEIQIAAMAGAGVNRITQESIDETQVTMASGDGQNVRLEWAAMLRLLDRTCPDFRS